MNMNPMALMQLQQRVGTFQKDHPKVLPFLQAVGESAVKEGTVFAVKVTTPEGDVFEANIKLTANDIETINILKNTSTQ
jgi:hypothetical protein